MYDAIQSNFDAYIDNQHLVASDPYRLCYWPNYPLPTLDYLLQYFPSDESIMEIMSWDEYPLEDHHHRTSLLPNSNSVHPDFMSFITSDIVKNP